jgi:hypothetical protein
MQVDCGFAAGFGCSDAGMILNLSPLGSDLFCLIYDTGVIASPIKSQPVQRDPTCGDVTAPLLADSETRDIVAVLFGEDSWYLLGHQTLPGATASSGPRITQIDVALEEATMVATMFNLAKAYGQSVSWTIRNNQYRGYRKGYQWLMDALDASPFSNECEHVLTALAAIQVGKTLNVPFTQWRAAIQGRRLTRLRPGEIRIAGTDFH